MRVSFSIYVAFAMLAAAIVLLPSDMTIRTEAGFPLLIRPAASAHAKSRPADRAGSPGAPIERPHDIREQETGAASPASGVYAHLYLAGTISGPDGPSHAVIYNAATGEQALYRPGDKVLAAEVLRIEPDRVILLMDGTEMAVCRGGRSVQAPDGEETPGPENRGIERRVVMLRALIDNLGADAAGAGKALSAVENVAGRKGDGIRVDDVSRLRLLQFMGLEQGDILRRINGKRLASPDDVFRCLTGMTQTEETDIEFLRDGTKGRILIEVER